MANKILTDTNWESRVRSKLGVDAAYLPDTDIQSVDVIDVAEANIIEQVPNYAELEGTDRIYLETATVCECAIILCGTMPARLPQKTQGPHMNFEISINWARRRSELEVEQSKYLGKITDYGTNVPRFSVI